MRATSTASVGCADGRGVAPRGIAAMHWITIEDTADLRHRIHAVFTIVCTVDSLRRGYLTAMKARQG
jgi:hypothetical protein